MARPAPSLDTSPKAAKNGLLIHVQRPSLHLALTSKSLFAGLNLRCLFRIFPRPRCSSSKSLSLHASPSNRHISTLGVRDHNPLVRCMWGEVGESPQLVSDRLLHFSPGPSDPSTVRVLIQQIMSGQPYVTIRGREDGVGIRNGAPVCWILPLPVPPCSLWCRLSMYM